MICPNILKVLRKQDAIYGFDLLLFRGQFRVVVNTFPGECPEGSKFVLYRRTVGNKILLLRIAVVDQVVDQGIDDGPVINTEYLCTVPGGYHEYRV